MILFLIFFIKLRKSNEKSLEEIYWEQFEYLIEQKFEKIWN